MNAGAGEPAASSPVNPAGQAARLTPGACGYWETTPPESLPSCGHRLRSSDDSTLTLAGECGYRQTQALDSLSACLARLDRAAQNCPVRDAWRLRMAGGAERRAEWRRCGPPEPEWRGDSAIYPTDYLLLGAGSYQAFNWVSDGLMHDQTPAAALRLAVRHSSCRSPRSLAGGWAPRTGPGSPARPGWRRAATCSA